MHKKDIAFVPSAMCENMNIAREEKMRGSLRNGKSKEHNRHGSPATLYYAGCIGT